MTRAVALLLLTATFTSGVPVPKERRPEVRGLGYLGAYLIDHPEGIRISEAIENQPAARSGLKAEDVLTRWDGVVLRGFKPPEFIRLIVQTRPNSVIPVEIKRNGQLLELKVRVGLRPEDMPYQPPMKE